MPVLEPIEALDHAPDLGRLRFDLDDLAHHHERTIFSGGRERQQRAQYGDYKSLH
jgi:hypothetical protein